MTAVLAPVLADVERVRELILQAALVDQYPAVVVDSPPGAGKTDLVEAVAAVAVHTMSMRVAVVTPKFEQGLDLLRRLRADYRDMPIQLFHSDARDVPPDIAADAGVGTTTRAAGLAHHGVIIATAAKLSMAVPDLTAGAFDLLVCDEAYQVAWKDLLHVVHLAPRVLLVGDPGQLPPIVRGNLARYEAAPVHVHWPAPTEMLRLHPALPRLRLPATFRFPQDTVEFVQPAFYPDLPFVAAVDLADRTLRLGTRGINDPVDAALDMVAAGASVVAVVLPPRGIDADQVDPELAELAAHVVDRLLARSPEWNGRRDLTEADVGYVDAHVASNAAVQAALRARGIGPDVIATTPEIWQGLQRPVMVTKHTLSGISRFDGFSLEPGRLSVMTSRHQIANVLVGRDGVADALARHAHDCSERPSGSADATWAGWNAHSTLWNRLEGHGRIVRV